MTPSQPRALKPARLTVGWLDDLAAQLGMSKSAAVLRVFANGLMPARIPDLAPRPAPIETHDAALARFEAICRSESKEVAPLCASRLFTHGVRTRRAFLLIHGLTNSPVQLDDLGQLLHARGHNVYIPLMPLHGRVSQDVRELASLTAGDLRAFADISTDIAAGLGDEVCLVGVSGGANVAVWIAQNRQEATGTSLFISPFFNAAGVPPFVSHILLNAATRMPNVAFEDTHTATREWVYRGQSSRGVAAVWQLIRYAARRAQHGLAPKGRLIMLTTAADDTSDNRATASLISDWRWAGAHVEAVEFDRDLDIAHNSLDPAADPSKRQLVHDRVMSLLEETDDLPDAVTGPTHRDE